jgi:two-component system sensor histidine kinase KdpD
MSTLILIERTFYHILENASEYTPPGSLIQINAVQNNNVIIATITDNGPGFTAGMEEKIFEKFTRGGEDESIPGIGLGLALCRIIIEAHGGQIHAENLETGGAKFVLTLPIETPRITGGPDIYVLSVPLTESLP